MTWLALWQFLKRIPWGVWLLAAAVAFTVWYGEKRHRDGQAEYRQQNKELRAELGKCAKVVQDQTKANQEAIKAADAAKAAAEAAERQAGLFADKFAKQLVGIDKAIAAAKRDPACRAILEERTCVALH